MVRTTSERLTDLMVRRDDLRDGINRREKEKSRVTYAAFALAVIIGFLGRDSMSVAQIGTFLAIAAGFSLLVREVIEVQIRIMARDLLVTMDEIDGHEDTS